MSTKTKSNAGLVVSGIVYVLLLVFAVYCKLVYTKEGLGSDISLALLMGTTIVAAFIVFGTDILVERPWKPKDGQDPPEPSDAVRYKDKKERAKWLLMHILIFAAVAVLPFEEAPRTSCLLILTLLVIELASIGAKDHDAYLKSETKKLEGYVEKGEMLLPYLVGTLIVIALWQKFDGKGFFTALYDRARAEIASAESTRERERKNAAPQWGSIFMGTRQQHASDDSDPLAGDQRVILHNTPPSPSACAPTGVHPEFTASVNNWRRPVDFRLGHANGIPLSSDSYIDITAPSDAVFVTFLAARSGAGMDLVLENGVCENSGNAYECRGSWHQGNVRGTYIMGVQQTGATVRLYAIVGGDKVEVGQVTIIKT